MRKADFPLLVNNPALHYLDSAATAQKPRAVIDAMVRFMENDYGSVNRGLYALSVRATDAYIAARQKVAGFINAARAEEIIFTRGATEAINLVAASWGGANLRAGDEIILTGLEHHANIVPWTQIAQKTGAVIKVAAVEPDGAVKTDSIAALVTDKTKLIACAHISNVLGTILPVADICALARSRGIVTLIDGCQAAPHMKIDVQAIGCDFYVFSSHKIYGPSGIGALYGRYDLLAAMPPYQTGGDMIEHVRWNDVTFKAPPARFEAGTPAIIEAVGFAAAIDYINGFDRAAVHAHEHALMQQATKLLQEIPGLTIHGTSADKASIIAFSIAGIAPYDLGTLAGEMGVCIRAGQHCAEPLHDALGVAATCRASFSVYNDGGDVIALADAIGRAREMLS